MNTSFAKSAYRFFVFWGVLSSLVITVCTIADATLIGNLVGSDGLAVTSLSTPVFLSFALFGITLGVGANVQIARAMGASDTDGANRIFHTVLTVGLIVSALCLLTLLFRPAFFRFLGVTETLRPLAYRYLTVVLASAPLFVMYHILSISVRTDSDPKLAAVASGVVIIANIALDLLFMLVLRWGIIGASSALCIAEALGIVTLLQHFRKKRALLRLRLKLPKIAEVGSYIANGFGMGSAYIFQALIMLVFNKLLIRYSGLDAAMNVAIFGVIYSTSMVPFAFYDGASNALSTITAFFLGEADEDSVFTVLKYALSLAAIVGVVLFLICFFLAPQIALVFGLPAEVAGGTAKMAIRFFSASIVFTGLNTIVTAFWQSIGRAGLATGMSVLRNFIILLIFGLSLVTRGTIIGVGMAYACTEAACSALALLVLLLSRSRNYMAKTIKTPDRVFETQYIIQTGSMEQIFGDLERVGEEWEIPMKTSLTLNFICEELLLNIIKFGMEDARKDHYIAIRLMEQDGNYVLRIRDNVRSYNPFETEGDAIDNGVLRLIQKKTKEYTYQRKMIFNYLYMVI